MGAAAIKGFQGAALGPTTIMATAKHYIADGGTKWGTGSSGYTHPFFRAPMSAEDLVRCRDAIAEWQRMTYGWMGRSPDYKAAFLATYGPNADYYTPFEENAKRWYRESQERVYFMNHTLVNPPVDRNRDIHEVDDVFIHAVKETDEGVKKVDEIIAKNPDKVAQAKEKPTLLGWFVGQTMKATGGKANPAAVNALLKAKLGIA